MPPRPHPPHRAPAIAFAALAAAGALALPAVAQSPAGGEVTIYRCTGADGRTSIGNIPCASGDDQQVRGMVRPVDGAPPPARPAEAAAPPPAAPARVVVAREPRPLYECVTDDGQRYDSDDGEGNPRWVPLWTQGYGGGGVGYGYGYGGGSSIAARGAGVSVPGGSGVSVRGGSGVSVPGPSGVSAPIPGRGGGVVDIGRRPGGGGGGRPPPGGWRGDVGGGGTWIRDDCRRLPQGEVCARLDDRLDESRRRFFNAQQRERDVLRLQERDLVARLAEDCA